MSIPVGMIGSEEEVTLPNILVTWGKIRGYRSRFTILYYCTNKIRKQTIVFFD